MIRKSPLQGSGAHPKTACDFIKLWYALAKHIRDLQPELAFEGQILVRQARFDMRRQEFPDTFIANQVRLIQLLLR